MNVSRRTLGLGIALAIAAGTLAACTPADEVARPVTTEEAQLLAVVRFNNFNAGDRSFSTSLRDAATDLALEGWVDYETSVGYAVLTADLTQESLLLWDASSLAARPITTDEVAQLLTAPVATPTSLDGFGVGPLNTDGALHPLLAILIALGNDRPDNPLLLQQGGALWLRTDSVDGVPVTVFAGPTDSSSNADPNTNVDPDASNARYWVDDQGLLRRFEVRLGADWVSVDFGPASGVALSSPFATTP